MRMTVNHSQSAPDLRPASERWLWRLMTAGLLAIAGGLVALGVTLYV